MSVESTVLMSILLLLPDVFEKRRTDVHVSLKFDDQNEVNDYEVSDVKVYTD